MSDAEELARARRTLAQARAAKAAGRPREDVATIRAWWRARFAALRRPPRPPGAPTGAQGA